MCQMKAGIKLTEGRTLTSRVLCVSVKVMMKVKVETNVVQLVSVKITNNGSIMFENEVEGSVHYQGNHSY